MKAFMHGSKIVSLENIREINTYNDRKYTTIHIDYKDCDLPASFSVLREDVEEVINGIYDILRGN